MIKQQAQDLVLPRRGPLPVVRDGGRIEAGRVGDAGEHRRLGQRQVFGALGEVALSGRLSPVGEVPVVYLVQIPLKDLVVAVLALQLQRDDRFLDLAFRLAIEALLAVDIDVLDQLLCDRAATAALEQSGPEGREVLPGRAGQAGEVHAGVAVEAGVLRGDGSADEIRGYLGQRHRVLETTQRVDILV